MRSLLQGRWTPPKAWLEAFEAASDEELVRLLERRPDLLLPAPSDMAELAARSLGEASAGLFYDTAERPTRQVLELLCLDPGGVPDPGARLGATAEDIAPVLEHLRQCRMILVHPDGTVTPNPALQEVIPLPFGLGPRAEHLFATRTNTQLMAVATRLGLSTAGAKPALVKRLVAALAEPGRVERLRLDAPGQSGALLDQAATHPQIRLVSGVEPHLRRGGPAAWCIERGLLVQVDWSTVVMPREVGVALRPAAAGSQFDPSPPAVLAHPVDREQVDQSAGEAALHLVQDVEAVAERWSGAPVNLLQSGGLGIREVRRLAKALERSDADTSRIVELAAEAGLVGVDESGAVMPTPAYDEWRRLPTAGRWVRLADAWQRMIGSLHQVGAHGDDGKPVPPLLGWRPSALGLMRRILLLSAVADAGPGMAADPAGVAARAEWLRPALWQDSPAAAWVERTLGEAALLGVAVGGVLSTFGTALTESDFPRAEELLARVAPPLAERVILQADLTATVAGEPPASLRDELDLLAAVESRGQATVWRFSEASVRRGYEAGRSAAEIIDFLERHAAHGVPQPLRYMIEDVGRRFGRLRLGSAGCYVVCEEPALLAEVLRVKKVAALGLRSLAPTVAITARSPEAVLEALRAAGYLPALEGADGAVALQRTPAHRVRDGGPGDEFDGLAGLAEALLAGGLDPDLDDDEAEAIDGLLGDLELLGGIAGLPTGLAQLLADASSAGAGDPPVGEELRDLVSRLRSAPPRSQAPPSRGGSPGARQGGATLPFPQPELFDGRPTTIVKDQRAMPDLLMAAYQAGWAVRMSYVNTKGMAGEFFAEILGVGRGKVRLRYLSDRHGGGELAIYRIEWVRVATEAEEEALGW